MVVGQGTRLFPDTGPDIALDLVDSRATSKGITIQVYRPTAPSVCNRLKHVTRWTHRTTDRFQPYGQDPSTSRCGGTLRKPPVAPPADAMSSDGFHASDRSQPAYQKDIREAVSDRGGGV